MAGVTGKICPELTVADSSKNSTDVEFEAAVEVTCDVGYVPDGITYDDMIVTCTSSSQWSPGIPSCRRKF